MKRAIVIYDTKFGNTKKIARVRAFSVYEATL